jgi:galactose mutarotase-like enzyme
MHTLENDFLKIAVKNTGAELSSLVANGKEYLWQGDTRFWGGQAPILFPFVGKLKNNTYFYKGQSYSLSQHGFFRRSNSVALTEKTKDKLTFSLESNEETKKNYPFDFEFTTSYELKKNSLIIAHTVVNKGKEILYFSLGEHPAFHCSLQNPEESYDQCHLRFEKEETAEIHLLHQGLIGTKTANLLKNSNRLDLHSTIFENDALVLKKVKSKKVTLIHEEEGKLVTLTYPDFPFLGIWSKPNAPFVCIEPWLGIADSIHATQKLEEKEGILSLDPGKTFNCSYNIEVHL